MTAKINNLILSVPPHLSVSWSDVLSLQQIDGQLVVALKNGDKTIIPTLTEKEVGQAFACHAKFLEMSSQHETRGPAAFVSWIDGKQLPFFTSQMAHEGEMGSLFRHNAEFKDAPNIPLEILERVSLIGKVIEACGGSILPMEFEDGCNCFHCQIARNLVADEDDTDEDEEDEEDEEETSLLTDFQTELQQWSIIQTDDKLFSVTNRLDQGESYRVYLGDPVGCTCGQRGCEHVLAVLKS